MYAAQSGANRLPRALHTRPVQGVVALFVLICLITSLRQYQRAPSQSASVAHLHFDSLQKTSPTSWFGGSFKHPVITLTEDAARHHDQLLSSQSTTLDQAIATYKRKFNRPPPKGFDLWFQAAKDEGIVFIDEYDTMTKSLEPFWRLPPAVLRRNIERADTNKNLINDIIFKKGRVSSSRENNWYLFGQLPKQLEPYTSVLLHIDHLHLLNNRFDDIDFPRVLLPYSTPALTMTAQRGKKATSEMPIGKEPGNQFSWLDLQDQFTWDILKLACPPESPVWLTDPSATEPEGPRFLTDVAQSKELCLHPRYRFEHGVYSPNTHKITFEPVPVLSCAKTSLNSDILIPSLYYDMFHVDHDNTNWEEKENNLYWAGSTTGVDLFEPLDWRTVPSHRHRFVEFVNDLSENTDGHPNNHYGKYSQPITLLEQPINAQTGKPNGPWRLTETTMSTQIDAGLYDVRFTADPQCLDEPTCIRQREHFNISGFVFHGDAYLQHRFLFDIDGNGFSGRFYKLLSANATVFKVTLFQEWHDDFLVPWYHYVPVSVGMEELPELMRFFAQTEEGAQIAEKIAMNAVRLEKNCLRWQDTGAGWARMMLELNRLLGDGRDEGKLDIFK